MTTTLALERCPHCGSNASVVPHAAFRLKCNACGKPRIPFDGQLARTDQRTRELLAAAYNKRFAKFAWQWASVGAALLGLGGLVFAALLALWASGTLAVTVPLALLPWAAMVGFLFAARKAEQRSQTELTAAWQHGVQLLYSAHGGKLSAPELAQRLGLDADTAAQALAEAEVQHWLDGSPAERLRVAEGDAHAAFVDPIEQQAQAELEAALGGEPSSQTTTRS
jgi:hypothetical protein